MNLKIVIGILISTLALLGALVWLAQPGQNSGLVASASLLESDTTLFDFGTISMANGKVTHDFQIVNASDQPINIRKIYSSCMCTSAKLELNGRDYGPFDMEGMGLNSTNVTLNPSESGILEAIYDPNAHGPAGVGPIDRYIYVEDKDGGRLEVEIKALVTP